MNRHAFKDMWNNFQNSDINKYEKVKNLENETLFPNGSFKRMSSKIGSSPHESGRKSDKFKYNESGGINFIYLSYKII